MFTPLQNLLGKELNRHGLKDMISAATICQKFRDLMPELLPPEAALSIEPKYFKNGKLVIATTNGAWSEVVLKRKEKIIQALNKKMGQKIIQKLQTKVEVFQKEES